MSNVAVVIPIGPSAYRHQRWWTDAIFSVADQDPAAIILVDDMAGLPEEVPGCDVLRAPWRLGVASAFNVGVAVALKHAPLALMMGADDLLRAGALAAVEETWCKAGQRDGYYWMWVETFPSGTEQRAPCNAAAVTAGCWRDTGGFPLESVIDAPDTMLISIMLRHRPDLLLEVQGGPYYMAREHPGQETIHNRRSPRTRDAVTDQWRSPEWRGLEGWLR